MISSIKNFVNDNKFCIQIFNDCININNYQKIITLEEDRISVSSDFKIVSIKGENLSITKLLDNEILITGSFKEVVFHEV